MKKLYRVCVKLANYTSISNNEHSSLELANDKVELHSKLDPVKRDSCNFDFTNIPFEFLRIETSVGIQGKFVRT